jgi:peptidoglycan/LPS O-acetylase OafA/YrhL
MLPVDGGQMGTLRLFLAISVALWHLGANQYLLVSGYVAVVSFFVISGFYMSLTIRTNYEKARGWQTRFYLGRCLRLAPTYLISLGIGVAIHAYYGEPDVFLPNFGGSTLARVALSISNITFLGQDITTFLSRTSVIVLPPGSRIVGISWSVAIEIWFYALVPFIAMRGRKIAVILAVVAVIVRLGFLGLPYDPWRYYFTPTVMCFFLIGNVIQIVCPPYLVGLACGISAAMIVGFTDMVGDRDIDSYQYWIYYASLAGMLPSLFDATKYSRLDRFVGDLSYPVYLLHGPLIFIAWKENLFGLGAGNSAWAVAKLFTILLVCAALLHGLAERPIEKFRRTLKNRPILPEIQLSEQATT